MNRFSPLQKRVVLAAVVLLLALFPNLLTVVVPVVAVLGWAVGQPLIAGIAVGAVVFARRRHSVRPVRVPTQSRMEVAA